MIDKSKVDSIMKNLSDADRKKIEDVMNDKDKLNQILASKEAQALLKKLSGEK